MKFKCHGLWGALTGLALAGTLILGGCGCGGGGGGGSGGPAPSPPVISSLVYSPTSVPVTSASGFTVSGSVNFTDSGGDVATLTLRITDSNGNQVSSSTVPISGLNGQTSGTIVGNVVMTATGAGIYTVHVTVKDSGGAVSNELVGEFEVVAVSSQARVVAATGPGASSLVVASGNLYWSETGAAALRRVAVAGGTVADLATRVVQIQAVAFANTDLIWEDDRPLVGDSTCGTNTISRVINRTTASGNTNVLATSYVCAPFTGSDIVVAGNVVYWISSSASPDVYVINATPTTGAATTQVTSSFTPIVALAGGSGSLYWMENAFPGPGAIRQVSTSGGTVTPVATLSLGSAANTLALDADNLYYTTPNYPRNSPFTEALIAQPLGGGPAFTVASAISTPTRLVAAGGQVLWIDSTGVNSVPVNGGSVTTLATSTPNTPLDLLISGSNVLWSETTGAAHGESGLIRSAPLMGGGATTVYQGGDAPRRLALDSASQLNWTEGGSIGLTEGFSRVACLTLADGVQTVLSGISSPAPAFIATSSALYIADLWRIKRLPLTGGMPMTVAADDGPVAGLAVDDSWVYWDSALRVSARKAPIAGGPVTVLADQGATVAISGGQIRLGTDGNLYWVSVSNALLSVPAAGGAVNIVAQGVSWDFVIDAANAYFLDSPTGNISKLPLTGGTPTLLASTGGSSAVALPLMLDGAYLYWFGTTISQVGTSISKVQVTGGPATPVLDFDGVNFGNTIAIDGTNVYWIEPYASDIRASAK